MKPIKYMLIICFISFLQGCPSGIKYYSCKFINKSNYNIVVSASFPIDGLLPPTALYPDTSIAAGGDPRIWTVKANSESSIFEWNIEKREDVFEKIDTLCVFVIHEDTIKKYTYLDDLNKSYNILRRYDLSLNDMNNLEWTLSYPPDGRMKYMKMYPRMAVNEI